MTNLYLIYLTIFEDFNHIFPSIFTKKHVKIHYKTPCPQSLAAQWLQRFEDFQTSEYKYTSER